MGEAVFELEEREPEVGGGGAGGRRGEPEGRQSPGGVEGPGGQVVGVTAAGQHGEGAAGAVLHHAPLRRHARVLEGLAAAAAAAASGLLADTA